MVQGLTLPILAAAQILQAKKYQVNNFSFISIWMIVVAAFLITNQNTGIVQEYGFFLYSIASCLTPEITDCDAYGGLHLRNLIVEIESISNCSQN